MKLWFKFRRGLFGLGTGSLLLGVLFIIIFLRKLIFSRSDFVSRASDPTKNIFALTTSAKNPSQDGWAFPGFFHFTSDRTIEGPVSVRFSRIQGLFNLQSKKRWTKQKNGRWFTYRLGCMWCIHSDQCVVNGTLMASSSPRGDIRDGHAHIIRSRPEAINRTEYSPYFGTLVLTCTFPDSLADVASRHHGTLSLVGNSEFTATTNKYQPKDVSRVQDVVCSRGMFGDMEFGSVLRFAQFYAWQWNFSKIIVYEFGTSKTATLTWEVQEQMRVLEGKLVVVDLRQELQRMYGQFWNDAVWFSASVMQMNLKADCLLRAKAFGARWSLHVDLDEFLFPSSPVREFPPLLSSFAIAGNDVMSLAILTVKHKRNIICTCGEKQTTKQLLEDFLRQAFAEFTQETNALPGLPGPFIHSNGNMHGFRGKRKLLIRMDSNKSLDVSLVGVHDLYQKDWEGRHFDPLKELYIREYTCVNSRICFKEAVPSRWFD